ncbi:MAG TPA: glycerate kinase [Kineosporiaceae bacterium]|nr:glycerate kinase [Kineosporiaceae bacterium]
MTIVVAPDKFKGSLTARQVAERVAAGLHRFRPELEVRLAPIADGGDGTLEAVMARGYTPVPVLVSGPQGTPIEAAFVLRDRTAVVELAEASGLRRLPPGRLNPMQASSRGTGDLIRAALDIGCDQVIIGLGGSACTDGGAGMLQALGVRLLDREGQDVGPGGAGLRSLDTVDLTGLDPRLAGTRVVLASDVDNPLLGPTGAASIYAPQKGASVDQVAELELGLQRWAGKLGLATDRQLAAAPGAGAAGGVGFAALTVLGAELRPGIEMILELIDFEELLPGASLVITGEGSLDEQSLHGKAPIGVATAATRHGVPTIAVAGRSSLSSRQLQIGGLAAAYSLTSIEPDPAVCIADAGRLLEDLVSTVVATDWLTPTHGG